MPWPRPRVCWKALTTSRPFAPAQCQAASPVRTLQSLAVTRSGEEIAIRAWARSFLHHQVRAMVGTLVEVGEGRRTPADVGAALAARDRPPERPNGPGLGSLSRSGNISPAAPLIGVAVVRLGVRYFLTPSTSLVPWIPRR